MATDWNTIFENHGVKEVTKTDKGKGAYVPNTPQQKAIAAAGIKPSENRPAEEFMITVLNEKNLDSVPASFYHAERETDPTRTPEPRMGHAFISAWLQKGDRVVLGNIGSRLFAAKETKEETADDLGKEIARKADPGEILKRAKKATGKPGKKAVMREEFARDPYVVAGAITRSKGGCEMPSCKRELFLREDKTPYLEVHHVVPLGEGGDDTLINAAALCAHCHRELHFGAKRRELRQVLADYVVTVTKKI